MTSMIFSFCLAVMNLTDSPVDQKLRDRFTTEAPLGWRTIRDLEQDLSGELTRSTKATSRGLDVPHARREEGVSFKKHENLLAVVSEREGTNLIETLLIGPQYSCRLKRPKGTNQNSMESLLSAKPEVAGRQVRGWNAIYTDIESPRQLYGTSLEAIIRDPNFEMINIQSFEQNNWEMVRVDFTLHSKALKINMDNAYVVLCPSSAWAVQEGAVNLSANWRHIEKNMYATNFGHHFALEETITEDKDESTQAHTTSIIKFANVSEKPIAVAAFSLTAFGLPEISTKHVPTSTISRGIHLWFYAAAGLFFFLAIGLKWRSLQKS